MARVATPGVAQNKGRMIVNANDYQTHHIKPVNGKFKIENGRGSGLSQTSANNLNQLAPQYSPRRQS